MKKIVRLLLVVTALCLVLTAFTGCDLVEKVKDKLFPTPPAPPAPPETHVNTLVVGETHKIVIDETNGFDNTLGYYVVTVPLEITESGNYMIYDTALSTIALVYDSAYNLCTDKTTFISALQPGTYTVWICAATQYTYGEYDVVVEKMAAAEEPVEHEHVWDDGVVTTAPTCTTKGVKTYTCTLDASHQKEEEVAIDPNAHEAATGSHNCKHCSVEISQHTGGTATCIAKAVCEVCGEAYGEFAGHTDNDGDYECDIEGCKAELCTNHAWNNGVVTTAPTCSAKGTKTYTCGTCGDVKTEEVAIDPDAHKAVEGSHNCEYCSTPISVCQAAEGSHNCATCGEKLTECAGGTATCEDKAVCATCGEEYGELGAHVDANADAKCETCGKFIMPEVGEAFVLKIDQAKLNSVLYFNGTKGDYYFNLGDYNSAVALYIEATEGGYHMYFTNNEEKTYVNLLVSGKYVNCALSATATTVWVWNAEIGVFTSHCEITQSGEEYRTGDYYLGTFDTNKDMRPSKTTYLTGNNAANVGVSQFPARAVVMPEHECDYTDATCTVKATCKICGLTTGETAAHEYTTAATCTSNAKCACGAEQANSKLSHVDANTDHVCDLGCTVKQGTCADGEDEDILCDYGCGKEYPVDAPVAPPAATTIVTVKVSISDYATVNGWVNSTNYNSLIMDSYITITAHSTTGDYNNTAKYYSNGTNWRMYQNENPEIKVITSEGAKIVSVKVTYTTSNTGILTLNGGNIASDEVVAVNATSITFSVGNTDANVTNGQVRITAIEVVYSAEAHVCEENAIDVEAEDATCTEAGKTAGTKCSKCGKVLSGCEEVEADGHDWSNNDGECVECEETCPHTGVAAGAVCTACGFTLPAGGSSTALVNAKLDLTNKENRTSFSTDLQVWSANGITVTNEKGTGSNIVDYAPPRFYKNSKITIEGSGMKTIVFQCDTSDAKYAKALKDSINDANATVTIEGKTVTVTFTKPVDSFTVTLTAGQVRMGASITVNP